MPEYVKIGGKKLEISHYQKMVKIENTNIQDFTRIKRDKISDSIRTISVKNSTIESLDGLENLPNLKMFWAVDTVVKNISALGSCIKLNNVHLEKTPINALQILKNKSSLVRLDLLGFGYSNMDELGDLSNLTALTLDSNNIVKISNLNRCKSLESLSLSNNKISKLEGLQNCLNLSNLNLNNNLISIIENLENLEKIKELSLANNRISDINGIENFSNLVLLNIADNQISDLDAFTRLKAPNLKDIKLSNNLIRNVKILGEYYNTATIELEGNPLNEDELVYAGAEPIACLYCNNEFHPKNDCEKSCKKELEILVKTYNRKLPKYAKGKFKTERDGYVYDAKGKQIRLYKTGREKVSMNYKLVNSEGLRGPICENCKNQFLKQVEDIYKKIKTSGSEAKIVKSIQIAIVSEVNLKNTWSARKINHT